MLNKDVLDFLTKTVKKAYLQIKHIKKEVSLKGTKDYVTNCDLLVENYIINQMKEKYPSIEILSEEYNFDKEKTTDYFVIDPIDGTINFANGIHIWGIQVGYVKNDQALVSCIYIPKLDLMLTAEKNKGCYLNGEKMKVKPFKDLENSLIGFGFSKANEKNHELYKEVGKEIIRARELGAASYNFTMVACGGLDAYCLLQNTPWDIEPGLLACIEAGAKFYRDDFCTIVANSDIIIELILKSIKKVFKDNLKY